MPRSILRTLGRVTLLSLTTGLASAAAILPAREAAALSPYLVVPSPSVAEASAAYRYANMTEDEALAELDRRKIPYKKADPIAGVTTPIRLTGKLHGVWIHSSIPESQRATSVYEVLDARLALTLDDFAKILERHDIEEVVHYSLYRPNVPHQGHDVKGMKDEGSVAKNAPESSETPSPAAKLDAENSSEKGGAAPSRAPASNPLSAGPAAVTTTAAAPKKAASKPSPAPAAAPAKSQPASHAAPKTVATKGTKGALKGPTAPTKPTVAAVKAPTKPLPALPTKGTATTGGSKQKSPPSDKPQLPAPGSTAKSSAPLAGATAPSAPPAKPGPRASTASKGATRATSGTKPAPAPAAGTKPAATAATSAKTAATSATSKPAAKSQAAVATKSQAAATKPAAAPATAATTVTAGTKPIATVGTTTAAATPKPVSRQTWAAPGTRHPAGLAIDVAMLKKRDGQWISVATHFQGKIGAKTCGDGVRTADTPEARELRSIVCEANDQGVFTYVLTPNYNAAHADHFHMEIRPTVKWFLYQ